MRRSLILVMDDGTQHVTLLRLALMQRGYGVAVIHAPERARGLAEGRPFDAVIVALDLAPAKEALAALGDARPEIAIVLASGASDDDARAAGFDAALDRPVDFGELDALLRDRLLRRASGTRTKARVPRRGTGTSE